MTFTRRHATAGVLVALAGLAAGNALKGFGSTPWYGLFAPAGTPKAIVAQLQDSGATVD